MSTKTVLINFVLDKSGSMFSIQETVIDKFNEYIAGLKKDKNSYEFTLTLFDTEVSKLYEAIALSKVKPLNNKTYSPNGLTALYDAVCKTLVEFEERENPVMTVILTDGLENSSIEYTEKQFEAMMKKFSARKNWSFIYLGANHDAWAKAQNWGLQESNVATFNATHKGMGAVMDNLRAQSVNFAAMAQTHDVSLFRMSASAKKAIEETK